VNDELPRIATVTVPVLLRLIGEMVDPGLICTATSWRTQRLVAGKKAVPAGQENAPSHWPVMGLYADPLGQEYPGPSAQFVVRLLKEVPEGQENVEVHEKRNEA